MNGKHLLIKKAVACVMAMASVFGTMRISPLYVQAETESTSETEQDQITVCQTSQEVIDRIRSDFKAHKKNIRYIQYNFAITSIESEDISTEIHEQIHEMILAAMARDGVADEGDYLAPQIHGYSFYLTEMPEKANTSPSIATAVFQINDIQYNSTAEQEQQADTETEKILQELDLNGKSDFEKAYKITEWLADNVTYDHTLDRVTGADALVDHEAVCEGYAAAFYRLATAAGLKTICVSGTLSGKAHGWNFVQVDGKYYMIDPTNANSSLLNLFLENENSSDFSSHVLTGARTRMSREDVLEAFPLADHDYPRSGGLETLMISHEKCVLDIGENEKLFSTYGNVTWSSSAPDIVSVSEDGTITGKKAGNAVITCAKKDSPSSKVECSVKVEAPLSAMKLNCDVMSLEKGNTGALEVKNYSSDRFVKWQSSDETVATVDDNGVVTAVSSGDAVITAQAEYSDVSAECKVYVSTSQTGICMNEKSVSLKTGKSVTVQAGVLPVDADNQHVNWSVEDTSIVSVENGKITGLKPGKTTVTVTTDDGHYSASCQVKVTAEEVGTVFLPDETTYLKRGETKKLETYILPENAYDKTLTWQSSDPSVATVDQDGNVTGVSPGQAVITGTSSNGKSDTCTIKVSAVHVQSVTLNKTELTLKIGDTDSLTAVAEPEDADNRNVTWSSSDSSVVSVDADGSIKALKAGTAVITASAQDNGKSASCTVTVIQPVTGVHLDETSFNVQLDFTGSLIATVEPSDATNQNCTWSSSDSSVISVDSNGMLTVHKAGTADIIVTTEDGGYTAVCRITVLSELSQLSFASHELTLETGETETPQLQKDSDNVTVTWTSSNPTVASVDQNGRVTGISAGEADITVSAAGLSDTCHVTVKQKTAAVSSIVPDQTSMTIVKGKTEQLGVTVLPENAEDRTVAYSSSDTSVASVDEQGRITGLKAGTANITVSSRSNPSISCNVTVTVKEDTQQTAAESVSMFRLYNQNSGEHFYTSNEEEKNNLVSLGWKYEGIGWTAPSKSNSPVYRLYNKNGGEHHYTMSADEKDSLIKAGWSYEGIGWYSDDNKSVPLYRQYNPNAFANNHNYSVSKEENDWLVGLGWKAEGIGWYGING